MADNPKVGVIMGSKSDLDAVKPCLETLKKFGVEATVRVISAHRTPDAAHEFAEGAQARGYGVLIAAAGKAAHLAGVTAAYTTLPVIGLPIQSSLMGGLDSLLSVVQMPGGVPVATVAVNGGENAGLLAVQILALKYPHLTELLKKHKIEMREKVEQADAEVRGIIK
jgi:5-(carboxyamino)imidazole ribonucleotide mutase